ncbi:MAG TPA: hypothetical protein VFS67_06540 [Polyangiaceae bacterium]|nr:hypothetical protein [Polyangiaceae bacterium]
MSFPNIEARISSPGELAAVLRQAKQCVARGILRQVKPVNAPFALDDLASIPDDGPWPDYVEAYFVDRNGKQYKLTVETYHGAGGSWGPV